jgi:N-acetyl-anhydromuramyl-L-alanine amidase AmpD
MLPSQDLPDIEIRRKIDPGPHFPWSVIMDRISLNRIKAED